MISRSQQILIKRAQREAGLVDEEYRDALEAATGCRSTTDVRLNDRHVDLVMAFFEAVYWRGIDAGALQADGGPGAVFRQRGYWAAKNKGGNTSRDRFTSAHRSQDILDLEASLGALGFDHNYCAAIRAKVTRGRNDPHALYLYRNALQRTLKAKQCKVHVAAPF